jgi:transposase
MIESLRVLKACRKTAVAARHVALQMIHNTIVCAPDELREALRKLTRMQIVRTLAAWRPDLSDYRSVVSAYRIALKSLGRRCLELHDEIADLDAMIAVLVDELAPVLVARSSIGRESAAQLLLTAGDNPERLHSEASFAALCGVSPVPASSGKVARHRLNRGGDRAANSALHIIAIGRLRTDHRTRAYVDRRIAEGHSKMEAIRCLKRCTAREVFTLNGRVFRAYVEQFLAPTLQPEDIVLADNLGSHKVAGVREAIQARGATLMFVPPYSPDQNPIEQAIAKLKALLRKAAPRTRDTLYCCIGDSLDAFTPLECANYLANSGYGQSA